MRSSRTYRLGRLLKHNYTCTIPEDRRTVQYTHDSVQESRSLMLPWSVPDQSIQFPYARYQTMVKVDEQTHVGSHCSPTKSLVGGQTYLTGGDRTC